MVVCSFVCLCVNYECLQTHEWFEENKNAQKKAYIVF